MVLYGSVLQARLILHEVLLGLLQLGDLLVFGLNLRFQLLYHELEFANLFLVFGRLVLILQFKVAMSFLQTLQLFLRGAFMILIQSFSRHNFSTLLTLKGSFRALLLQVLPHTVASECLFLVTDCDTQWALVYLYPFTICVEMRNEVLELDILQWLGSTDFQTPVIKLNFIEHFLAEFRRLFRPLVFLAAFGTLGHHAVLTEKFLAAFAFLGSKSESIAVTAKRLF